MDSTNKFNSLAEFVGISAPEIPKYLLLNNFLYRYFKVTEKFHSTKLSINNDNIFICEESEKKTRELLNRSLLKYFDTYTGKDIMSKKKADELYFPINTKMITTDNVLNLRNLLYALQINRNNSSKSSFQVYEMLSEFFFNKESIGSNKILNFICSEGKPYESGKENFSDSREVDFGNVSRYTFFVRLSRKFNEDLEVVLSNKNFKRLDFYRKLDYLSTFLTFYVIQYILERINYNSLKNHVIICKGSVNQSLNYGDLHRTCVINYAKIRSEFPELVKKYFEGIIENINGDRIVLIKENDVVYIKIDGKNQAINNIIKNVGYKDDTEMNETLINHFFKDKSEAEISKDDLAQALTQFQKSRKGSSISKISSTLPTCGREIGLIFPRNNSRHKYFAFSEEIAEFFVRLYLSSHNIDFAYLEEFIIWLEDRYNICITKSEKVEKYLKKINAKVSIKEFNQNEEALIENLSNINCLIKLSDSGYVVTLPEKRGEFKLI